MQYKAVRKGFNTENLIITASNKLGRGATAIVYKVTLDRKEFAAKIYHDDRNFDSKKIKAMLENPPANCELVLDGQTHTQLAWPLAIIEDDRKTEVGFILPLIDPVNSFSLDHYYDQGLFKKLNSREEGSLSYKLEIAKNLSRVIAYMHLCGHFFIDCKPQNIRVFKRTHMVTLIDCDGFSVNGKNQRFPAELLSTDYIAPEVQRRKIPPTKLGEPQDRYALAVILFQLLNYGTHPFQGIIIDPAVFLNTNDEKAAAGLYPHGLIQHRQINSRPQSIHHLWDQETRSLFDQAFTTGSPSARPSAQDWVAHFESFLRNKNLARCTKYPDNLEHIRFKSLACPMCYLKSLPLLLPQQAKEISAPPVASQATSQTTTSHAAQSATASSSTVGAAPGYGYRYKPLPKASRFLRVHLLLFAVATYLILLIITYTFKETPYSAPAATGATSTNQEVPTQPPPSVSVLEKQGTEPLPPRPEEKPGPVWSSNPDESVDKLPPPQQPAIHWIQVGAFQTIEEAETKRAELALIGVEARVIGQNHSGRMVYRVRIGPFEELVDATDNNNKLRAMGLETNLVQVQR